MSVLVYLNKRFSRPFTSPKELILTEIYALVNELLFLVSYSNQKTVSSLLHHKLVVHHIIHVIRR